MSLMYYRRPRTRHMNTARTDVLENEDGYVVRTELAGFEKEEISVEADFETLRITAEHKVEETEDEVKPKFLMRERYEGKLNEQ